MNFSQSKIKTVEIKTIKHLNYVLGCNTNELEKILSNIDKYYYEKREIKYDKNGKPRLDKNGNIEVRIITPSKGELKSLQKIIHRKILTKIMLPENIKGSVKGSDSIKNAKFHQGNKYKFATDLKKFFPSISHYDVMKMLLENGFSKKVASIITKLTTYKGKLPQGTPTSPTIANLVFLPIDYQIIDFCRINDIKYTRYVDDLSFSAKHDFQQETLILLKLVKKGGFKISHKKTFYTSGIAEFTGIVVGNNTINIPERIRKKLERDDLTEDQVKGLTMYKERVTKTNKRPRK